MNSDASRSEFADKVVLVTGSTSGIGKETALYFARSGARVVVTGRNVQRLEEVARECVACSPRGYQPLAVAADITDESHVKNLVKSTGREFGKIDVLINCAGIMKFGGIRDPNVLKDFDKVIKTNLRAVFNMCHLVVPFLVKSKGSIVNVSSIASMKPVSSAVAYSAAKSGLDTLTRCLAVELGPLGVRVNGINPSIVKTGLFKETGMEQQNIDMLMEYVESTYPLRRHGVPADISRSIAFLASSEASFITGATLLVDGGALFASSTRSHDEEPSDYDLEEETRTALEDQPPLRSAAVGTDSSLLLN